MIDIQNKLFTKLATDLRTQFSGITVVSAMTADTPKFPTVQFEEISNLPIFEDSGDKIDYARLTYRVRVYTNSKTGKAQQARKIIAAVDDILEPMNMVRTGYSVAESMYSNSIYLITASYSVTADKDGNLYRQ